MYQPHKLSNIFPKMDIEDYQHLKDDISVNGLLVPITLYQNQILDGRHRQKVCSELSITPNYDYYNGEDPLGFIISLNLKRRHLTPSQKAALAIEVLPLLEEKAKARQAHGQTGPGRTLPKKISEALLGESAHQAGKLFGVSGQYVKFARAIKEQDQDLFEEIKTGGKTLLEARKQYQKRLREEETKGYDGLDVSKFITLHHGDFRDIELSPNSVQLILTDPPYPEKYLDLWEDLAKFAEKVLKPGGHLVTYAPQLYLGEILNSLSKHLTYFWTMVLYQQEGPNKLLHPRNIICQWKPILVFVKPPLKGSRFAASDVIVSDKREKDGHEWQQSMEASKKLIDMFSAPGEVVLDPFSGSGTFLKAASDMKRRVIGIEIEKNNINFIKSRFISTYNPGL